jgi:hypothetical protein
MSRDKLQPTALDYMTVVLSPALIMGLVGSLVFFLLEVFYRADGPFKPRLQWILAFHVFGIVLAARVSMQGDGAARSTLYSLALSALTYLGMQSFVEYPPEVRPLSFLINLALVGVVWWCSHRLVWDCTHVDDDDASSAEGLLQAAGIEGEPGADAPPEADTKGRPLGWAARYQQWRASRSRAHVLGVWVVYFSLAALPIFGLGQALVPLADEARRRTTFWLMTAYVGCGLGLLLTTCFLGLRRYLRQRGVAMPARTTAAWAVTGLALLGALLLVGALLPRPYSEYPWASSFARSPQRKPSQAGQGGTGVQDQGKPRGIEDKDGPKAGKDGVGKDQAKGSGSGNSGKDGKGTQKGGSPSGGQGSGQQTSSRPGEPPPWMEELATWIKWAVFFLLAILAVLAALWLIIRFLANFSVWARRWLDWWNGLWSSLFGDPARGSEDEEAPVPEPDAPFSAFVNPFVTGRAEKMSPRQLLRLTLAAFEAWAGERGLARRLDETSLEHLERVCDEHPGLHAEGLRLVMLHAQAEYGREDAPSATLDTARAFWQLLGQPRPAPQPA